MGGYRLIFLSLLIWLAVPVWGQLSDGGLPLEVPWPVSLKSKAVVALPSMDNERLLRASQAWMNENQLKPLRFAQPVEVSLNTENSGRWLEVGRYRVWQLVLRSEGAKSLNLIFDRYQLPDGARLFMFSADRTDLIGAFTSKNNSSNGVFASSPVAGDQLIVQYEEPLNAGFEAELSIRQVNHDFIGIQSLKSDRRPLGHPAGECNINVNCDWLDAYRDEKNAACRIIVSGIDLCSGALVNNTQNDGTPYVYTAGHCITTNKDANESVFLFNYESPYCGDIDGDASHSLSGSALRATSDSLDFTLVELATAPPPDYRPYYLGWDRSEEEPDSTVCLHHPAGDVKKIAIDRHRALIKSYSQDYKDDGFLYIGGWEEGTTEGGSSGAALLNHKKRLVGSLTGGAATCESPYRDYFARLSLAWNYYSQENKQLKRWLDPGNSNVESISGYSPYTDENLCGAYTNFRDEDTHASLEIVEQDVSKGYWSGTNDYGFVAFAERIEKSVSSELAGVSIGVDQLTLGRINSEGKISVAVYSGDRYPDSLLYVQDYGLKSLDKGVMNYLPFSERVQTNGVFFIVCSIELLEESDIFSVFLAKREVEPLNSFFIQDGAEWYTYQEKTGGQEGSAMLMEVILCNVDTLLSDDSLKNANLEIQVFPNPFHSGQELLIKFDKPINPYLVQAFDLMGRQVAVRYEQPGDRWLSFDFSGLIPGHYLLNIVDAGRKRRYQTKVIYLGDY
ncbi:trypsin-like peptidase domain-containing protein [uncultured Sunxiuqinia sp.]|uniref:trypsin-like peptidase domain-containing protein n=1 Tax=uncultured Sunxiuqinia sp. TaxID=1573825 RepID=UPI0030D98A12|tara:strand:- start:14746 stop:16944 length:2199 start_codon:yes stop_codon:yes gene_type:complete